MASSVSNTFLRTLGWSDRESNPRHLLGMIGDYPVRQGEPLILSLRYAAKSYLLDMDTGQSDLSYILIDVGCSVSDQHTHHPISIGLKSYYIHISAVCPCKHPSACQGKMKAQNLCLPTSAQTTPRCFQLLVGGVLVAQIGYRNGQAFNLTNFKSSDVYISQANLVRANCIKSAKKLGIWFLWGVGCKFQNHNCIMFLRYHLIVISMQENCCQD